MSTPITNEDLRNLVLQQGQTPGSNVPASFRPIRPTRPIPPAATLPVFQPPSTATTSLTGPGASSGNAGIPKAVLSVSVNKLLVGGNKDTITLTFTHDPSDQYFANANVYLVGYQSSTFPVLVSNGSQSPITFQVQATGESVVIYVQAVNPLGVGLPVLESYHTTLTLDPSSSPSGDIAYLDVNQTWSGNNKFNGNTYLGPTGGPTSAVVGIHLGTNENLLVDPASEITGAEGVLLESVNDSDGGCKPLFLQGSIVSVYNNSAALVMTCINGVQVGNPVTGGDQGAGTINVASGIYLNGTSYTNPDYVLEAYYSGQIEKFKGNPGAEGYTFPTLEEVESHIKEHWQLPRVGDKRELFSRVDILLEKVEELYLHIIALNKRVRELEAQVQSHPLDIPINSPEWTRWWRP